ncbi:MAG TPA: MFS transporter [Rhizomicrobium sp.]|nr:MFS transporter [Rhizomicrobium sp.]
MTPEKSAAPAARAARVTVVVLAAGLFGIWGLAQWLYNTQFQQFAAFFNFSQVQIAWTLSLFQIAYFVLAIPAALFHRQFGYKLGLLLSLSLFANGGFLLYLAVAQHGAAYFVCAVLIMGSGWAWLETCLNPLATEAGRPQSAILRLNAIQIFNGAGLLAASFIAHNLAASHLPAGQIVQSMAHPFIIIGLAWLLLAVVIEQLGFPASAKVRSNGASGIIQELRALARDKSVVLAAAALAAYCITLTVIWSAAYNYRIQELGGRDFNLFGWVYFWFCAGRFILVPLMRWIDPVRLLQWCACLSLAAVICAFAFGGMTGWVGILAISCFMSITFPTVFAATITRHGTQSKLISGLLVAGAGFGGAVGPLFVTPALQNWPIREVLLLAIPFVAVIVVWTVSANRDAHRSATLGALGAAPKGPQPAQI